MEHLAQEQSDLTVVGGGIIGVAVARDASLRGFRAALVDKKAFGAAPAVTLRGSYTVVFAIWNMANSGMRIPAWRNALCRNCPT